MSKELQEEIVALKSMIAEKSSELGVEFKAEELQKLEIDWSSMVREEDMVKIRGDDFIKLAGLRRLARLRGYLSSTSRVVQPPEYENHRNCTVEHTIQWADGIVDCHAADASWRTINDGFKNFPVAMACNRAEARCIRASLGIEMCSHEEIGPDEGDEDLSGPSNDQQKSAINMLMARHKVSIEDSIERFGETIGSKIVVDDKFNLNNTTYQEAIKIMASLNKPIKKKK